MQADNIISNWALIGYKISTIMRYTILVIIELKIIDKSISLDNRYSDTFWHNKIPPQRRLTLFIQDYFKPNFKYIIIIMMITIPKACQYVLYMINEMDVDTNDSPSLNGYLVFGHCKPNLSPIATLCIVYCNNNNNNNSRNICQTMRRFSLII